MLNEKETASPMLYVQSFCTSQNEVLALLENASGKKFEISRIDSAKYIMDKKDEMEKGVRHDAMEELVAVLGLQRAGWMSHRDFASEMLGLQEENLEKEVHKALETKHND